LTADDSMCRMCRRPSRRMTAFDRDPANINGPRARSERRDDSNDQEISGSDEVSGSSWESTDFIDRDIRREEKLEKARGVQDRIDEKTRRMQDIRVATTDTHPQDMAYNAGSDVSAGTLAAAACRAEIGLRLGSPNRGQLGGKGRN
jgi:hypothetical protein